MARIIVTGGAGFIGSHVADAYIKGKHKVAIIDNLKNGNKRNINKNAKFYHVDIANRKELREVFEDFKPNYINHHAANSMVRVSIEKPYYDARINILGSLNLINLAQEFKIKRFIYINSGGAGYGEPENIPVKENHPIKPLAPYGASKHAPEKYLYVFNYLNKLDWISLRYANIYGPRQDPHGEAGVVAIFIGKMLEKEKPKIFGTGEHKRDYAYIDDVIRANLIALTKKTKSKIFNIGTGIETSVNQIYEIIKKELSSKIKALYVKEVPEVERISLDITLAKKELAWEPKTSLKKGIKKTIDYMKKEFDAS